MFLSSPDADAQVPGRGERCRTGADSKRDSDESEDQPSRGAPVVRSKCRKGRRPRSGGCFSRRFRQAIERVF
jgi:hypothetical protein